MFEVDRIAAVFKPTSKMLDWLNNQPSHQENLTLKNLRKDCMILLIPSFDGPKQSMEFIKGIYSGIFEAELISWGVQEKDWPTDRTFDIFREWFDIEFHSLIFDIAYIQERQQAGQN